VWCLSTGHIIRQVNSTLQEDNSTTAVALRAQANRYLVDLGATWHTDAFLSDFTNYFCS